MTDVSTTCAIDIFRVKVSCITSVDDIIPWLFTEITRKILYVIKFEKGIGLDIIGTNSFNYERFFNSVHLTGYKTRLIILTTFLVRTITARTFLDGTLTVTLIPTLRPTLALLRQRLYRTSEAPLKLLHVYYNLAIYVLHTNR